MIEYILLIAAVLSVLILFLAPGGKFHRTVEGGLFGGTIKQLNNAVQDIRL